MDSADIHARVAALLKQNTAEGRSKPDGIPYRYVKPSAKKYSCQWFWDTFFHIFMLCALQEHEAAKGNLRSLFALQKKSGFIGHMLFWENSFRSVLWSVLQLPVSLRLRETHMSALIQPCFAAQALLRLHEETGDEDFTRELYPKVKKYLEWLSSARDIDNDGLISIITPFESGMDFKPSFDLVTGGTKSGTFTRLAWRAMRVDFLNTLRGYNAWFISRPRSFLVKEVTINTAYVQDLFALASLSEILGYTHSARRYRAMAERNVENMLLLMYDGSDAAFYDVESGTQRKLTVLTPTIFFPALLPGVPRAILAEMMERHFHNPQEFAAPFSIPSVAMNEPSFQPGQSLCLWRGPTWIFNNWFLARGLRAKNFIAEADLL